LLKIELDITSQKNKSFEGNERKKMKTRELSKKVEEKCTKGAFTKIYSAFLPTAYLNNIIFNYFIGDFSKICR